MSRLLTVALIFLAIACEICSSGREIQRCGDNAYYCKVNGNCLPRSDRCVGRGNCVNLNGSEDNCGCDQQYGSCSVYLGTTPLRSSSSSSKKRNANVITCIKFLFNGIDLTHHFVTFRGFTWEFGASYLSQVLDINDPNYKYNRPTERVTSMTYQGESSCTYAEALAFSNNFEQRYCLCTNNCQHFAKGMITWLLSGCTYSGISQSNEAISEYFTMISQSRCNRDNAGS